MATWRFVVRLLVQFWGKILLTLLFSFFALGSNIGLMMTSAWVLSYAALKPSIAALQLGIVGVRFFGISRGFAKYVERLLAHDVTFRILGNLRVAFFERILKEDAPPFYAADLLQRVMADINRLENLFIRCLSPLMLAVLLAGCGWMLFAAWHVQFATTFFVASIAIGLFLPFFAHKMSQGDHVRYHSLQRGMGLIVQDTIQGAGDIRVSGRAIDQQARLETNLTAQLALQKRLACIQNIYQAIFMILGMLAAVCQAYLAIPLIQSNQLQGLSLAVVVLGILAALDGYASLPTAWYHWDQSVDSLHSLGLVDTIKSGASFSSIEPELRQQLKKTCRNLAKELLNHITEPGLYALTGASGVGKSTAMQELARFLAEKGESVLLVDRREHVFTASFRENLCIGDAFSDEELWKALNFAGADELVRSRPKGLEDFPQEKLSGGERQRLILARALLRKPNWLILDEATAHCDLGLEGEIIRRLTESSDFKYVIHVGHRLDNYPLAKQIFHFYRGADGVSPGMVR